MAPGLHDSVTQEILNLLSLHARDVLMVQKAGGAKDVQQESFVEDVYHGSEAHASLLQQFIDGKSPYDGLFEQLPITNNRPGNNDRASTGFTLRLRDELTCDLCEYFAKYFFSTLYFTRQLKSITVCTYTKPQTILSMKMVLRQRLCQKSKEQNWRGAT